MSMLEHNEINMIKIAHIQLLPLLSGVQRVSLDELQRLDPTKFDRYIICKEPGPLTTEAEKYGIKTLFVSSLCRNINLKKDLQSFISLIKLIKKFKFDVVHTHSSKTGVLGRLAAKLSRVSLIVHTVHGFSFPAAKTRMEYLLFLTMEKVGYKCCDFLICLHEEDKNVAIKKLNANENNIQIIPNGVDVNKFKMAGENKRNQLRQQLGFKKESFLIGMTGRLWEQKNPLLLLKVFNEILKTERNIHLLYVGDGELKTKIMVFCEENDLSNHVHLMGWQNDTTPFFNVFDIFVLPSLWEGMPLAILEAQSSSLACIASDIPGNRHLITNGYDGMLFSLNDSNTLKSAITDLLQDPNKRRLLGSNAREKVLAENDIVLRVDTMEHIYERSLNSQKVIGN